MGVIIPLHEAQVSLVFRCTGQVRECVTTFGVRPDIQSVSAQDVAGDVRDAYVASGLGVSGNFSSSWTFVAVRASKMTNSGVSFGEVATGNVGTQTANTIPMNGAVLIRKVTQEGGRRNKGRMFWPPLAFNESIVSPAGVIATAELAAEQTKWSNFLLNLSSGDYPMVVMHDDGSPSTLVSQLVLQALLATQRRRMR
mgnify:FL=1